jgi:preprotein translocase subunit SecG
VTVKSKNPSQRTLVIVAIITALFFIGFCIFLAALLARYQKRGRKSRFEEPDVKFSKLVDE